MVIKLDSTWKWHSDEWRNAYNWYSGSWDRRSITTDFKTIDNLHISHNTSGMEANIQVLSIRNSRSHSLLVVNGLELPCLAATLCLNENMVTRVVRSCAVYAKVSSSKLWTDSLLYDRKFNLFLIFLARGHGPKYFLKVCS